MQKLLADRFKLLVHWETREMPVYELVVAKGGAKLPATTRKDENMSSSFGNGKPTGEGLSAKDLAVVLTQVLSQELGREVVDKTGLSGKYDFTLRWTQDGVLGTDAASNGADVPPSIFTAVEEQLGLKLQPAKGPVQVLVVDDAEMPTEN
jgi:uncharacterized protein (TIGR03435 family)